MNHFKPTLSVDSLKTSVIWELDFCARPILDERGKKLWELLVTDADRSFVYSEFFRNNMINSTSLKLALKKLFETSSSKKPNKCIFFRSQMQSIITRALTDLEIKPIPSRRCLSLMELLEERLETVYKKHPGFNIKAVTACIAEISPPKDLRDELKGDIWNFVQLSASELQKEVQEASRKKIFGSTSPFEETLENIKPDKLVPGIAVFSQRAIPLSAWTCSLELASISLDIKKSCLILETGLNQRWSYGSYRVSEAANQEARAWERAKKNTNGLHFLVIQPDPESELIAGLWLMKATNLPTI
jgi:hypothetical protein